MSHGAHSTIPSLFAATVTRSPDTDALGIIKQGELTWHTWAEIDENVRRTAASLRTLGVKSGTHVAQWAPNSYSWITTDLALLSLGAVHVPLHTSLSAEQALELLNRSESTILVVDRREEKIDQMAGRSEMLIATHEELLDGDAMNLEVRIDPEQLATLLFTSGTTGEPRGVMLSHRNLACNAIATSEAVGSPVHETRLCFLPLSHIYARTCDLYSWIYRGTKLALAESRETIVRDCQLVRPRVINGVPYFFQKVAQQLQDAEPGTMQRLLGGELRRCFCGGAPVAPGVEKLFEEQGLPILSGYGLTETSPVISATSLEDYRAGTVGRVLPNLELKLADDGEILVRGPSVMLGYWRDERATTDAIVEGWLHTGDLGSWTAEGRLQIVGRRKELIVLSTGKKVAPEAVEQRLRSSPLVEHVCVVGEGQKYLGALIVPNPEMLRHEIRRQRLWVWSRRRAVSHPKVRERFRQEVLRFLTDLSTEQQLGCFTILDRNFSQELGELTPKLSLCRQAITAHFQREIEKMYARGG